MLADNHLTLRLVRLQRGEEWAHQEEGFVFIFLQSGSAKYEAGPTVQLADAGDVLVVNGSLQGKLQAAHGAELLFWWFKAELEQLYPLFASKEIGALHNVQEAYRSVRLYRAATPIARDCKRLLADVPPQLNLEHRGHVIKLAAAILSREFAEAHAQRDGFLKVEEHVRQVLEHLSIDEIQNLSVCELAEKFSCSRRHLNRLFHQYFGLSVAALRMEMRLLKAISLLRDPEAKIINVADECCFNHLGLFNMCFRKRFGTTPGEWRKKYIPSNVRPGEPSSPREEIGCLLGVNGLCPWGLTNGESVRHGTGSGGQAPPNGARHGSHSEGGAVGGQRC